MTAAIWAVAAWLAFNASLGAVLVSRHARECRVVDVRRSRS